MKREVVIKPQFFSEARLPFCTALFSAIFFLEIRPNESGKKKGSEEGEGIELISSPSVDRGSSERFDCIGSTKISTKAASKKPNNAGL